MNHHDELYELLMAEVLLNDLLEVEIFSLDIAENVLINPTSSLKSAKLIVTLKVEPEKLSDSLT